MDLYGRRGAIGRRIASVKEFVAEATLDRITQNGLATVRAVAMFVIFQAERFVQSVELHCLANIGQRNLRQVVSWVGMWKENLRLAIWAVGISPGPIVTAAY